MDSILPFLVPQPRPQITMVGHLVVAGRTVTAITRRFDAADVPRCSLCPLCTAYDGVCTVMVDSRVEAGEAAVFDANATAFQPAEDRGLRRNTPWMNN